MKNREIANKTHFYIYNFIHTNTPNVNIGHSVNVGITSINIKILGKFSAYDSLYINFLNDEMREEIK